MWSERDVVPPMMTVPSLDAGLAGGNIGTTKLATGSASPSAGLADDVRAYGIDRQRHRSPSLRRARTKLLNLMLILS